jgi:hypothetical protein
MLPISKHIEAKQFQQFQSRDVFSRDELFCFSKAYEPDLRRELLGGVFMTLRKNASLKT